MAVHQESGAHEPIRGEEARTPLFRLLASEDSAMEEVAVQAVQVVAIAHQLEAGASRVDMVEEVEEIGSRQVESGFIQRRH
jgi:hypothetical protein